MLGHPLKLSYSPRCLGHLDVASGFSQIPMKSSLQEKKTPREDDSGLLEQSCSEWAWTQGGTSPVLDARALEMNLMALQELPSSPPQFSLRPVDSLDDNASRLSAPDLCTVTLQALAPAPAAFSLYLFLLYIFNNIIQRIIYYIII